MKYKTNIVPRENGYVGEVILNEEVIYTSSVHRDPIMVTRELTSYIAETLHKPQPIAAAQVAKQTPTTTQATDHTVVSLNRPRPTQETITNETNSTGPVPPAPRKCCGRK